MPTLTTYCSIWNAWIYPSSNSNNNNILINQELGKHTMPCDCVNCKKDNILNGTLKADCSICKKSINTLNPFQVMGDKSLVCDVCIKEYFVCCNTCRKLHKKENTKKVILSSGESPICERCFAQYFKECASCHGYFDRHDVMMALNFTYCKSCFQKNYQVCSRCSVISPTGTMTHITHGTRPICDNCYNIYGEIGDHTNKPKIVFHGKGDLFYGIELEVQLENGNKEQRGPKAKEVLDLMGSFVIVKEDGSLNSNGKCGFEICSQPASKEEHYVRWGKFFDKLPTNLMSYKSGDCGLHIHCSRKPLSLLTIAKAVVFVNETSNQPRIETIAGRKANQYTSYAKKKYGCVRRKDLTRNDRYEAINLTNRDTIEFRIFRGTLKRESFFKALEFCDSLLHFCMTGNNGIVYCRNIQNYFNYVALRSKDYPHLYAFICAKFSRKETKLTKQFGFTIDTINVIDGQH